MIANAASAAVVARAAAAASVRLTGSSGPTASFATFEVDQPSGYSPDTTIEPVVYFGGVTMICSFRSEYV